MEELVTTIISTLVLIVTTVGMILTSKSLTEAVIKRFTYFVNGAFLSFEDLKKHDVFTRLHLYSSKYGFEVSMVIHKNKQELFKEYVALLSKCHKDFLTNFLVLEIIAFDESEFKAYLTVAFLNLEEAIQRDTRTWLLSKNDDVEAAELILYKLTEWRVKYSNLLLNTGYNVLSQNVNRNNAAKTFSLFSQYSVGIDLLILNGAESFNSLNGDLNNYYTQ